MRDPIDVVLDCLVIEGEHAVFGLEQLLNKELEELFSDASFINARFTLEYNSHRLLEVLVWLGDHSQSVVEDAVTTNFEYQVHSHVTHAQELSDVKLLSLLVDFV